jgi:hypothetical protein
MSQKLKFMKITYYALAVLVHLFFINWLHLIFPMPLLKRFAYLTSQSLYINTAYYTSMLLVNLKFISFNRNFELGFFKFCYVLSFVVFVQYWGLVFIQPQLLIRKDIVIPFTLDLFLHGANFVLNLVESKIINPRENYNIHFIFYVLYCIGYGLTLKAVFTLLDWAIYPFVAASHLQYVIILTMGLGLVLLGDLSYTKLTHKHAKKLEEKHIN